MKTLIATLIALTAVAHADVDAPLQLDCVDSDRHEPALQVRAWTKILHVRVPQHLATVKLAETGETLYGTYWAHVITSQSRLKGYTSYDIEAGDAKLSLIVAPPIDGAFTHAFGSADLGKTVLLDCQAGQ